MSKYIKLLIHSVTHIEHQWKEPLYAIFIHKNKISTGINISLITFNFRPYIFGIHFVIKIHPRKKEKTIQNENKFEKLISVNLCFHLNKN